MVDALSLIAAVVDPAVEFLFCKLLIAQISPCLPPMLQGVGTAPVGGRHSVEYIVSCFVPDALTVLVKQIFPPLLAAPFAVFIQRTDRTHDMKMGIGNASILFVGRVNGEVHHHAPAHKLLQQKLPCKLDVLLHGKLVLQSNVKAVCKLRFLSLFRFLHLIPECFPVRERGWGIGRQQDFRTDHAALFGVVAVFAVVFAVQLFAGAIGGSSHDRLSGAALDLCNMKMI